MSTICVGGNDHLHSGIKLSEAGADLGFSEGGGADISQIFENFLGLFFKIDQSDFLSSPESL